MRLPVAAGPDACVFLCFCMCQCKNTMILKAIVHQLIISGEKKIRHDVFVSFVARACMQWEIFSQVRKSVSAPLQCYIVPPAPCPT